MTCNDCRKKKKYIESSRMYLCTDVGTVHYNMKNGFWKFGRVIKTGPKKHRYEATITETAKYAEISREEAIARLKGGDT